MRQRLAEVYTGTILVLLLAATGCVNRYWQTTPHEVARPEVGVGTEIRHPVKAHLADGSTVIYRDGASVSHEAITGDGVRYELLSTAGIPRPGALPMDSVVGLEGFDQKLVTGKTVLVSTAATALGAAATLGLLKALFGSCPTVYADEGHGAELQAEGFSYSIAPMLEQRDLDPVRARPDSDGRIRLELRNEALETHYINHIELVGVTHARGARALPDQSGRVVVVSQLRPLSHATDRAGRDLRQLLAARDGQLFASDASTLAHARAGDLHDWIELEADSLPPGDSIAVVLRLRNSLVNTVLLYDVMLSGPDGSAWLTDSLQRISRVVELARWYTAEMGMHATVSSSDGPVDVRLPDVGPIAFRDVAIVLPRALHDARSVRVRLRFVVDNWRIDEAMVAATLSRPRTVPIPLAQVTVPQPQRGGVAVADSAARAMLARPDAGYLETRPGQRLSLEFRDTVTAPAGQQRSYFIGWQGWYAEWIRPAWLLDRGKRPAFAPGDDALLEAISIYRQKRAVLEEQFSATRIPVR